MKNHRDTEAHKCPNPANRPKKMVEGRVIVELKTVERILPIHEAQLLTYLRLAGIHTGLILNFQVPVLRQGIKRMVV